MTIKGMALACLAMLISGRAAAFNTVDIGTYFPDVVQGHHGDNNNLCNNITSPQFKQYNSSRINGTLGRDLKFCGINSTYERPAAGCDTASGGNRYCSDTSYDIRGLKLDDYNNFLGSSGAAGSIWSCSNGETLSLGSNGNQYGTVLLYARCTASVSARYSEYRFSTLEVGSGARLVLTQGDYWVDKLSITDGGEIILQGDARLFINKNATISSALVNMAGKRSLLLIAYGDLTMTGNSQINGYVYSNHKLAMNNSSLINGRVASRYLFMEGQSLINKKDYVGDSLDHYELYYPSQSLTCEGASIQLLACQNDNCSQRYVNGAQVTLSPANGWTSNPVAIGSSGQAALTLSRLSNGNVSLGLTSSAPSAPLRCYRDGVLDSSCSMSFTDAALRFDFSTFYAGSSTNSTIRAIKSSDVGATKVCVPLLTGNQTLQFGSTKIVSDTASNAVPTINGSTISPSGNVNVLFDGNGVGQLTLQYPDAGVLRLDATFQKNDVTGTLKLTGSDTVAVIPKAIALQAQGQSGCSGSNDNTYAACPVYRKAGESFTLQARALNEQDQLTPGFATSNKAISWALLAPAAGGTGTFSPTAISLANGVANNVVANWSEVGVIQLGVSNFVPYPAYQDESPQLETVQRWSSPIGRFVPWDYSLSGGFITPACNTFTYMSQPFASGFVITARNSQQGTTQNYQGAFAKGEALMVAANALDGVARDKRITLSPSLSWASGVASVNQQSPLGLNTRFDRAASPEAPFATLSFGIKVDDKDGGNTRLATPNMNAGVAGACSGAGCDAVRLGTQKLLYGRLQAGTAAGLASAPLAIPLQMQYYEGGNWLQNKEDQCTQLSLANQGFIFLNPSHTFDAATRELNLGAGRKIKLGLGSSAPGGDTALAKDGEILFHFAKPDISVRIPYKVELAKQPSQPLWLSDPTSANDGNLQGEAIFGSSRGNDRIIYRREVLQ
ncbi:DUF6701 domain-containing protein [Aeromonas veronii]|uniref:DUF6701 domain-containing protein n=1 Tax=Aeromonas veronii TaxID=654 RepID=UPI0038D282AF